MKTFFLKVGINFIKIYWALFQLVGVLVLLGLALTFVMGGGVSSDKLIVYVKILVILPLTLSVTLMLLGGVFLTLIKVFNIEIKNSNEQNEE